MFTKANLNDAKLIFDLRFEKLSSINSISQKKISYISHLNWFRKKIKNKKDLFLIFNKDKGYIRVDSSKNKKFLSWSINKVFRKKGYGYKMLKSYLLNTDELHFALIKKSNLGSINLVKKVGFKYEKKLKDGLVLFSFKKSNL